MKIELKSAIVSLLTLGASAESNNLLRRRKLVELSNCAADCTTLPLILTFKDACKSTECQAGIMGDLGITDFQHLTGLGMIFVNDLTDTQLDSLQTTKDINTIECDSCISGSANDPVCGTDGKTYKNEQDLSCGLKCRGADPNLAVASRGACAGSAIQSVQEDELITIDSCPDDGSLAWPLIMVFKKDCDVACAKQVMGSANIASDEYKHLESLNMITLYEGVSEVALGVLRRDTKNIDSISCDGQVTTQNGDDNSSVGIGIGNGFGIVEESEDDDSYDEEDDDVLDDDLADDVFSDDEDTDAETTFVNDAACPAKQPILGGPPQSCDPEALTSDCKYSPGPCMLDPTQTCHSVICTCFGGSLQCAQDGNGGNSGGGGGQEATFVNDEACPAKQPILGGAPQSCDAEALQSDCKYSPGPCMLDPNQTCYSVICTCFGGSLQCAQDGNGGNSGGGQDGGNIGTGIVEVPLNNCPDDGSLTTPLMIGFQDTCHGGCLTDTMRLANIKKGTYEMMLGSMIKLNEVTTDELKALRSQPDNIKYIECNGEVQALDLGNCPADGSLRLPLIVTFAKGCDNTCAIETIESAGLAVNDYVNLENLNMVFLNKVTGEQLDVLRANSEKKIAAIACDSEVSITLENCVEGSPNLPLLITFRDSCNDKCAADIMKKHNIEETQYDHLTHVNIIILKSATSDEIAALEGENQFIDTMECDGEVTTLQGCDEGCMTMPLIITFKKGCDAVCAGEAMRTAEVDKASYEHLASVNTVLLNEVTDKELEALRSNSDINTIECDSCVVANEVAQVCGTNGVTYKNEDELNCGLKCNGASPFQISYFGACQATEDEVIEIAGCDPDCMTMPLMFTFTSNCDADCAVETFEAAGVSPEKYDHLTGLNIINLNEVSDGELTLLQLSGKNIATIECNTCASVGNNLDSEKQDADIGLGGGDFSIGIVEEEVIEQVCGSNGVTYASQAEFDCGLKCRGADKSVTIASQGVCAREVLGGLVSLECDSECMRMPIIIGFKGDCDDDCAMDTMKRANIADSNFDYLSNLNMVLLNAATDEQIMILRGEDKNIMSMECDSCASIADDSPVCASNGVTFKSADQLTCDNQCRGAKQLSVSYLGECVDTSGGDGETVMPVFCFSSTNQVQLSNGEVKQISEVQLGDKVLTQNGYENVYSWSHYNTEKEANFVQLLPSRVELSPNHLIMLENGSSVPAAAIKAGDVLLSGEAVSSVRSVKRVGVYAPFTNSGTIVVNNEVASTFVSLQEKSDVLLLNGGFSTGISHQWLAHTFEFPHRFWCSAIADCAKESYTVDGISTWVASPLRFFTWFLDLPFASQMVLSVPILSLFGIFAALDVVMNNYLVFGALSLVSGLFLSRRKNKN